METRITITEALSEVNLIKKKIETKKQKIQGAVVRHSHLEDPYATEGGSAKYIERENHAVRDLYSRLVKIRSRIADANLHNEITINGKTMPIQDWLTWKREVAKDYEQYVKGVCQQTDNSFSQLGRSPQVYKNDKGETCLLQYTANINLPEWQREAESVQDTFQQLDGQLSLKNATITILLN